MVIYVDYTVVPFVLCNVLSLHYLYHYFGTKLSRNLIRPRCAKRAKCGRGKPVLIHYAHILTFSLVFTPYLTQLFRETRHIIFQTLVALKMFVSLISRLVASSPRIVVDKQTSRQTDRHTERLP